MNSSILSPAFYEADFRPIIGVTLIIIVSIVAILIKYWDFFKDDFHNDWE